VRLKILLRGENSSYGGGVFHRTQIYGSQIVRQFHGIFQRLTAPLANTLGSKIPSPILHPACIPNAHYKGQVSETRVHPMTQKIGIFIVSKIQQRRQFSRHQLRHISPSLESNWISRLLMASLVEQDCFGVMDVLWLTAPPCSCAIRFQEHEIQDCTLQETPKEDFGNHRSDPPPCSTSSLATATNSHGSYFAY